jgi:hypothetical protein
MHRGCRSTLPASSNSAIARARGSAMPAKLAAGRNPLAAAAGRMGIKEIAYIRAVARITGKTTAISVEAEATASSRWR